MSSTTLAAPKAAISSAPVQPSFNDVVELVMKTVVAAGVACHKPTAHRFVHMLQTAVNTVRSGNEVYFVEQDDLDAVHRIMEIVMPDEEAAPRPGTAHAALNRFLLKGSEISVVHTADTIESRWYCAVTVSVRRA